MSIVIRHERAKEFVVETASLTIACLLASGFTAWFVYMTFHEAIEYSTNRKVIEEMQYQRCFDFLTNEFHGYDIADNRCDHIVYNVPLI